MIDAKAFLRLRHLHQHNPQRNASSLQWQSSDIDVDRTPTWYCQCSYTSQTLKICWMYPDLIFMVHLWESQRRIRPYLLQTCQRWWPMVAEQVAPIRDWRKKSGIWPGMWWLFRHFYCAILAPRSRISTCSKGKTLDVQCKICSYQSYHIINYHRLS